MQAHKKLKARILSLALSAAMVTTMMPMNVFAAEGDTAPGVSTVGTIQSFDKLENRFTQSIGENAPTHVYGLTVALDTPVEDLNLPDKLTAMVERTTVTAPDKDEPVADSGKVDKPAEDETIPDEDTVVDEDTATDDTVSGNQPASPSDAEENEEIPDEDVPLAPEPEQDKETTVTTTEQEIIPVTWNSDKEYKSDKNGGPFIYTAELPEDYILADGVELPQIYVLVGNQARGLGASYEVSVGDVTAFKAAFANAEDGDIIKVTAPISLGTSGVTLDGSKAITLDLNGNTISFSGASGSCAIATSETASLTVADNTGNGKIESTSTGDGSALKNLGTGSLNVSGGTITSVGATVIANRDNGTIAITGGRIEATGSKPAIINSESGKITISGSNTVVTSSNTDSGTIRLNKNPVPAEVILDIQSGTVSNTATSTEGYSVYFNSSDVTSANLSQYYTKAAGATVGKVYPAAATPTAVAFKTIEVNGTANTVDTTELTLTFDKDVTGLAAADITVTGATKGTLTKVDGQTGQYKLAISAITVAEGANVNVAVAKTGFTFTPANKDVAVHKAAAAPITVTINGSTTASGATLNAAIGASSVAAGAVTSLKITAGKVTEDDWKYLESLTALTTFEIDSAVDPVANIPDMSGNPSFSESIVSVKVPQEITIGMDAFFKRPSLTTVNVPAATTIGDRAFYKCTSLTNASLLAAESIGENAFYGCDKLATLKLGATPPQTVGTDAFKNCPATRALVYVDADGNELTGTALTEAQAAYKAKDDGNTGDNLWYGWTIEAGATTFVPVTDITSIPTTAIAGTALSLTGTVAPANATNKTIVWSVKSAGATGATISGSTLNTTAAGTVTVTATITNGLTASSNYTKDFTITVNAATTAHTITASAGAGGSISPSGTVTVNNGASQTFAISANSNYSISSVSVDGANQGAISTYTFSNVTGNHTISAAFSYSGGGSSGGGGGSSSGGGGSSSTTTPTKPTEPVTGSSNTNATVDNKGNVTANVTTDNISDAVKAAKDAATKKGVTAGEVTAVINVTAPANSNPNTVTVNLPKTVQDQIISNKIGNVAIVIDKPDISIGMTLATITEMNKQANADIQLSATRTDATKLSTEAKNAIGNRPAFDLKATYASGAKSVTNFGSGTVSVAIPYTLQNGEVAGGLYAVYVDGNGKVNYITNSSYDADAKMLRFSTNHFSVYGISYKAPVGFTDIASHWAKTDIEFVVNRGLMNGTSNTTFSPDGAMTRGMFVTALGRLAGVDVSSYKTGKFTDVKTDAYYAPYVNWAADKGIVKGTTDTTFAPDQSISRQEMAVMMSNYANALGYKVPETRDAVTFADNASIGSWAAPAVKQMQMAGILNGKNGNKFDPTGTATRGEISAMLHRYVSLIIDKATTEGWTTNDSGSGMYYKSGKALVGAQTISGVAYNFNNYGETTRKTATAGAATTNPALPVNGNGYTVYIVRKGDNLSKIAAANRCTVNEILALNNIQNPSLIFEGQQIKVPQR